MHESSEPKTAVEPGAKLRRILQWLYFPYVWLVFIPFLAVTTVIDGIIAVLICFISPRAAFHMGTFWAWCLCRMNFSWVSVRGRKNAKKGQSYVVMSNHQSHFDILAFYGHWGRQFRWVMKKELRKVPGLGWYCAAGGHIFIDRSNREKAIESLRAAKSKLEGGVSVMIFPEGTRSNNGRMRDFKKGGFMMALDMGLPILPVSISNSRHVLPNRTLKLLPGNISIKIHQPIDVSKYTVETREELMAEVRKTITSGLTDWERGEESGSSS